jgi:4-hydroxy-tetrahydrodipicolinate reductase
MDIGRVVLPPPGRNMTRDMSATMINLAITGAAGRMGMRLVALGSQSEDLKVVSAIERADSPRQGHDAGEVAGIGNIGVPIAADLAGNADVVIDFTSPAALRQWLKSCRERNIALVIGTTGLGDADHAAIDEAAKEIPILQAPNMSLGVNLLFKLAGEVAKKLGEDYDIEIVEGHHRFKKDAPSGTAMGLAEAILKATGKTKEALVFDRHGDEVTRQRGDIGMHALRIGDEVGRHTAYFAALGERLELTHVATSRDTFVRGALAAARWLATRTPGRYGMGDVLRL